MVERRRPSYFIEETIPSPLKTLSPNPPCFPAFPIFQEELQLHNSPPFFFDEFDTVTELIQIETAPFRQFTRRIGPGELELQALCNRVLDLEMGFERLHREEKVKKDNKKKKFEEKKYSWTAEMETAEKHRKYNLSAETKGGEDEKKSYKWTVQVKGKGCPVERTYRVELSSGGECAKQKKNKAKENDKSPARTIQIEEPSAHGAIVLRQVLFRCVLLFNFESISNLCFG